MPTQRIKAGCVGPPTGQNTWTGGPHAEWHFDTTSRALRQDCDATGTPGEIATEVSINTALGVERVVRYAFELAARRRRRSSTASLGCRQHQRCRAW